MWGWMVHVGGGGAQCASCVRGVGAVWGGPGRALGVVGGVGGVCVVWQAWQVCGRCVAGVAGVAGMTGMAGVTSVARMIAIGGELVQTLPRLLEESVVVCGDDGVHGKAGKQAVRH